MVHQIHPMGRTLYFWISTGAFALYAGLGLAWSVANLGDVPHYGDTVEYLRFAREGSVGTHRGVLYPWLIAATEQLCVAGELPHRFAWANERAGDSCSATSGLAFLQLFQVLVSAACLAYFVFIVMGHGLPAESRARRLILCLLPGVLLLDPLINHFNFALMSDGLAFSASLAFCAALADLALGRTRPWTAMLVLITSYLVAAGLRVEKRWTLLLTLLCTLAAWAVLRRIAGLRLAGGRPLAIALGLLCLSLVLVVAVHRATSVPSFRMPLLESAAHLRVVFPHLGDVYEDLPSRAKRLISPDDARYYDEHVNNPPMVLFRASGGDPRVRWDLTKDLVGTVAPKKWPVIARDWMRDVLENLFATGSFYLRVAVWRVGGIEPLRKWFASDAAVWDYRQLVFHHPRLSAAYIAASLLLIALATPMALRHTYQCLVGKSRAEKAALTSAWIPALVFWVVNAVSFASYINITNIRYVIMSHTLLLAWVYAAAVCLSPSRAATADSRR